MSGPAETPLASEIAECRRAIEHRPADQAAYGRLGHLLLQAGRPEEAVEVLQRGIALKAPAVPGLYLTLGGALYKQKRLDDAIAQWQAATRLAPDLAPAWLNIGMAYRKLGKRAEAIAAYEKAVALQPERAAGRAALGGLYKDAWRFDEAEKTYAKLLEIEPGSKEAILGLAAVYERTGKVTEAYHLLRPFIDCGTDDVTIINAYAIAAHRVEPPAEDAIPLLQELLAQRKLPDDTRRKVLIALGQLCDALERPEAAFGYFEQAHALDPDDEPGRRVATQHTLSESARAYTAERLAKLPRASHGSELPVFVLGMPRSGTTLTEQIVSSHPQVHGAGELKHLAKLSVAMASRAPYPECLDRLRQRDVDGLAAQYLAEVRKLSPAAARITDKMPFNFQQVGLIEILFPRARVVHCMRHPLDTCLSVYFNELTNFSGNRDLPTLAAYYREYWELMEKWRRISSVAILQHRYEDMIARPEEASRRLVAFCGLEWHDACLRFYESTRIVDTLSYYQVRRPIYNRSVGRYKPYARMLEPLRAALADVIEAYESGA